MSDNHPKKQYDVVIIGAGIAGLSTALSIQEYNITHPYDQKSYVILEASGEVGGRVKTVRVDGLTMEHGAQWLHGSGINGEINPLLPYAYDPVDAEAIHKLKSEKRYTKMRSLIERNLIRDTAASEYLVKRNTLNWQSAEDNIKSATDSLSSVAGNDTDISASRFAARQTSRTQHLLQMTHGPTENGANLQRVGVRGLKDQVHCDGGYLIKTGTHTIIQNLQSELRNPEVRLNTSVEKISRDVEGYGVALHNKETIRAKSVVITPSINILKANKIKFEPPLPSKHRKALDTLQMGNFNKIFFEVDSSFRLPINLHTHVNQVTRSGNVLTHVIEGNAKKRMITTLLGGREAANLNKKLGEDGGVVELAIKGLEERFPGIRAHITLRGFTQWDLNPHINGSYSYLPPDAISAQQDLAAPISGGLLIAGEVCGGVHPTTKVNWNTQMAGAFISGVRAGKLAVAHCIAPEQEEKGMKMFTKSDLIKPLTTHRHRAETALSLP